jgi:hypothetical protein
MGVEVDVDHGSRGSRSSAGGAPSLRRADDGDAMHLVGEGRGACFGYALQERGDGAAQQ